MGDEERAAIALRLQIEYVEIGKELSRMRAELQQTGTQLIAEGKKLIECPENSYLDAGSVFSAVVNAEKLTDLYRTLLARKDDKRQELAAVVRNSETAEQCKTA